MFCSSAVVFSTLVTVIPQPDKRIKTEISRREVYFFISVNQSFKVIDGWSCAEKSVFFCYSVECILNIRRCNKKRNERCYGMNCVEAHTRDINREHGFNCRCGGEKKSVWEKATSAARPLKNAMV